MRYRIAIFGLSLLGLVAAVTYLSITPSEYDGLPGAERQRQANAAFVKSLSKFARGALAED